MSQLVCEDCGEVLDENLTEDEVEDLEDSESVRDERESDGDEKDEEKVPERGDVDDIEDDIESEYEEKADELGDEESDEQAANEAEAYYDAALEVGMGDLDVLVGDAPRPPQDRLRECEEDAERISRIFMDKLRQKRQEKVHREQTEGRFDSGRMIQAERGSARVFKQRREGDELRYEVYFVLDRSSSMRGTDIRAAEQAVMTLMLALEDCGIATELIDFAGSDVSLVKTKARSANEESGNILRADASGGTPLDSVTELIEERITGADGEPFVVVVTDAELKGSTKEGYMKAVERMQAPVLGVTIGDDAQIEDEEANRLYHYAVQADHNDNLSQKLTDLARGVML